MKFELYSLLFEVDRFENNPVDYNTPLFEEGLNKLTEEFYPKREAAVPFIKFPNSPFWGRVEASLFGMEFLVMAWVGIDKKLGVVLLLDI